MDRLKILLVDDEADFRETMGAIIKGWGYNLIEAANGKEAIDVIRNKKADIVILDYMMPEMDGVTTLKEIRKIDKEVPVIMFTAYPDGRSFGGANKLGAIMFIPKLSAYSDNQAALKEAIHIAEKKLNKKE